MSIPKRIMSKHRQFRVCPILFSIAAVSSLAGPGLDNVTAQTITEIIDCTGDGTGDCITLTGNDLNASEGIAVDAAGNVYVTGFGSANAFKITPAGVITEIIDAFGSIGGVCGDCNLTGAGPGCSDPDCQALVCAMEPSCCNTVWQPICASLAEILCGCGGVGHSLNRTQGIALDATGNVYVVSDGTNRVFKITPTGFITEIIDETGDGAGFPLSIPEAIAVDGAGNVFVTSRGNGFVFKITPAGAITQIIDFTSSLIQPRGIAADAAGNVYVAGRNSTNVLQITPAGVNTQIIGVAGDGAGNGLLRPHGVAVDAAGNVYVAGGGSDNAFKITPAGAITEIIDATGDGAGNTLDQPHSIAVDAAGNAYVTGEFSSNVFRITPTGEITEIMDSAGDGMGNVLQAPQGVAVDAAGNVYVAGSVFGNAFKITVDADGDGVLDAVDDCPNNTPGLPVAGDGRPLRDCNGDCFVDGADIQCVVEEMLNQ